MLGLPGADRCGHALRVAYPPRRPVRHGPMPSALRPPCPSWRAESPGAARFGERILAFSLSVAAKAGHRDHVRAVSSNDSMRNLRRPDDARLKVAAVGPLSAVLNPTDLVAVTVAVKVSAHRMSVHCKRGSAADPAQGSGAVLRSRTGLAGLSGVLLAWWRVTSRRWFGFRDGAGPVRATACADSFAWLVLRGLASSCSPGEASVPGWAKLHRAVGILVRHRLHLGPSRVSTRGGKGFCGCAWDHLTSSAELRTDETTSRIA